MKTTTTYNNIHKLKRVHKSIYSGWGQNERTDERWGHLYPSLPQVLALSKRKRKKQFLCPSTKRELTVRRDHTNNMEIKIKYLKSGD